jgi:hypothetical protein
MRPMAYVMAHGDPRTFPGADSYHQLRALAEWFDFAFARKQEVQQP